MRACLIAVLLLFAAAVVAQDRAQTQTKASGMRFWSERFELNTELFTQFRLTVQDERGGGSNGTNGRDFANFRVSRAKLTMYGHIFEPEFKYRLRVNFTAAAANEIVEIATLGASLASFLNLNAGQDRVPWDWERRVTDQNIAFLERSYVNEVFHQDYGKGIWINGDI